MRINGNRAVDVGGGGGAGSWESGTFINTSFAPCLRTRNYSLHGDSVNENGAISVSSVLSTLLQMSNYKHIRKLCSFSCLALPSVH